MSSRNPKSAIRNRKWIIALAALATTAATARAQDVSSPVILQWFESTYGTIESRMPDVFAAGYGSTWYLLNQATIVCQASSAAPWR